MKTAEQRVNSLARDLVKAEQKAAAERNRRLYAIGALVERCGLFDLDDAPLAGLLLAGKSAAGKPWVLEQCRESGAAFLAPKAKPQHPVWIVRFPGSITRQLAGDMRRAGLRENRTLRHWEGAADLSEIREAIAVAGGTARLHEEPAAAPGLKLADAAE